MTSAGQPRRVLSIVGPGRSGSTLLASILGEVDGVASAGELRWLWSRGLLEQRPCACGLAPSDCSLWSRVIERLDTDDATIAETISAQRQLGLRRNRLRLLRGADGVDGSWTELTRLRAATDGLCRALADVTGAHTVVDTSKRAQDAAVLAGIPSLDHYVVHLVRDPRAVAYSWRRRKQVGSTARTMGTRRLLPSALRWTENCGSAEVLRRHISSDRWHFVRYEDFAAAPRPTVEAILGFLRIPSELPFLGEDTVALSPNHIVAGNPTRFTSGEVRIRLDDEWSSAMARRDQLGVAAVAGPFMRRYGYPLRAEPAHGSRLA